MTVTAWAQRIILPPVVCWHRSAARGTWHPDPDYRSRAGEIDCAEPAWIQTQAWPCEPTAWILDESGLAGELLGEGVRRLRAPGVRGASGAALTALRAPYIDTGPEDPAVTA